MIRHYEAKKIDDGYFDIKIMEIRDYLADERAVVFLYKNNEKGGETCGCIWGYPKVFLDEKGFSSSCYKFIRNTVAVV